MKKILVSIPVLLAVLYLAVSWVYSSFIILAPTGDFRPGGEDVADRKKKQMTSSVQLPDPMPVTIWSDDISLDGAYYENPEPIDLAVILLPGRSGTKQGGLRFAEPFWNAGYHILVYDPRAAGNSGGEFQTAGFYERHDSSVAVDWLVNSGNLEPGQIGILGGSYGAAIAIQTLAVRDDLAFIIADSPFADMRSIVEEYGARMLGPLTPFISPGALRVAEFRADFDVADVSPEKIVGGKSTPVLLIHGIDDQQNSVEHSRRIHAAANSESVRLEITDWGPGHTMSITNDYKQYEELVLDFIAQTHTD